MYKSNSQITQTLIQVEHNLETLNHKRTQSTLSLLGAVLYKLYPVTFGNDNKSYQNKSHNEITVKLRAKVG